MSDFEDAILKSGGLPNAAPAVIAQRMFDQVSKGELSEYQFGTLQKNLAEAMGLTLAQFFDHPVGKITLANRPLYGITKQMELMKAEGLSPRTDAQTAHERTASRSARNDEFKPRDQTGRDVNSGDTPPENGEEEGSYTDGDSQKRFDAEVAQYMKDHNLVDTDKAKAIDAVGSKWNQRDKARKEVASTKFRNMQR